MNAGRGTAGESRCRKAAGLGFLRDVPLASKEPETAGLHHPADGRQDAGRRQPSTGRQGDPTETVSLALDRLMVAVGFGYRF
jgi:hypothetical protein